MVYHSISRPAVLHPSGPAALGSQSTTTACRAPAGVRAPDSNQRTVAPAGCRPEASRETPRPRVFKGIPLPEEVTELPVKVSVTEAAGQGRGGRLQGELT